jgi:hypothetical protein
MVARQQALQRRPVTPSGHPGQFLVGFAHVFRRVRRRE